MFFPPSQIIGATNNCELEARKTIIKLPQNQTLKPEEEIKKKLKNKNELLKLNQSIMKLNNIFDTLFSEKDKEKLNIEKFQNVLTKIGSLDENENKLKIYEVKYAEYLQKRQRLIKEVENGKYNDYYFTYDDERANLIFIKMIKNLRAQLQPDFFKEYTMGNKDFISKTSVYKILKKMPKGANLHLHVDTAFDPDWYLKFAYHPNAYIKLENGRIYYREKDPGPEYIRIIDQRNKAENIFKFDEEFKKTLTINYDDLKGSKNIWSIFQEKLWQVDGLLLFKDYFYQYLIYMSNEYIKEGIFHIEAKIVIGYIVDENGKSLPITQELELYRRALIEIKKECSYFSLKLIVQGLKGWSLDLIDNCLKNLIELMKTNSDLIVGFDLVQEEDRFKTIAEMAEILIKKDKYCKDANIELDFVLHGGESLNYSNQNLFDLILLKTKRIGHALNLTKHSYLMDIVKKEKIGIEICPCSNQILGYIYDLRLHPGITYLNKGLKVIICPDDPGYFQSNYISFDFFMAAVALEFNLKDLKMCCFNSLDCSLLKMHEKRDLINIWNEKWDIFVKEFLNDHQY